MPNVRVITANIEIKVTIVVVVNEGESSVFPIALNLHRPTDPGGLSHILERSVPLVMKKGNTVLIKA